MDLLPEGPAPLCEPAPEADPSERPSLSQDPGPWRIPSTSGRTSSETWFQNITQVRLRVRQTIRTAANTFGLYREYEDAPHKIPDEQLDVTDLREQEYSLMGVSSSPQGGTYNTAPGGLGSYPNISTLNFLHWFWNGGTTKSVSDRDRLIKEVFHSPKGFNPQDIQVAELHKLDAQMSTKSSNLEPSKPYLTLESDGWIEKTVEIPIPDSMAHAGGEVEAPKLSVPNFYYRKLTNIIETAFKDPAAGRFHFIPYRQYWTPQDQPAASPQRVVDEMYSSDAFLAAHEEVQCLPPEPNCSLPRAVAGLMFASDSLQLTSFGDASLWPCYLYFANQSKWERTKPRAKAAHHIAYFPRVSII